MFGLSLYRVRGASMEPTLRSGDLLLLRQRGARHGDVVVVEHPRFGTIVKRVGADGLLQGDGEESTDASRLGKVIDAELRGVAVLVITPSGLRRPGSRSCRRAGA